MVHSLGVGLIARCTTGAPKQLVRQYVTACALAFLLFEPEVGAVAGRLAGDARVVVTTMYMNTCIGTGANATGMHHSGG